MQSNHFFPLQFAAHSLRVAHDCSPPAPAEDCVARLWVWEHKSSAPASYDARLWSAAGRGNCQPIHHNNKRPRDSAPSAQVLHVLLHSNTSPLQSFPFFSQPFRIIIPLTPWSWVTGGPGFLFFFLFAVTAGHCFRFRLPQKKDLPELRRRGGGGEMRSEW